MIKNTKIIPVFAATIVSSQNLCKNNLFEDGKAIQSKKNDTKALMTIEDFFTDSITKKNRIIRPSRSSINKFAILEAYLKLIGSYLKTQRLRSSSKSPDSNYYSSKSLSQTSFRSSSSLYSKSVKSLPVLSRTSRSSNTYSRSSYSITSDRSPDSSVPKLLSPESFSPRSKSPASRTSRSSNYCHSRSPVTKCRRSRSPTPKNSRLESRILKSSVSLVHRTASKTSSKSSVSKKNCLKSSISKSPDSKSPLVNVGKIRATSAKYPQSKPSRIPYFFTPSSKSLQAKLSRKPYCSRTPSSKSPQSKPTRIPYFCKVLSPKSPQTKSSRELYCQKTLSPKSPPTKPSKIPYFCKALSSKSPQPKPSRRPCCIRTLSPKSPQTKLSREPNCQRTPSPKSPQSIPSKKPCSFRTPSSKSPQSKPSKIPCLKTPVPIFSYLRPRVSRPKSPDFKSPDLKTVHTTRQVPKSANKNPSAITCSKSKLYPHFKFRMRYYPDSKKANIRTSQSRSVSPCTRACICSKYIIHKTPDSRFAKSRPSKSLALKSHCSRIRYLQPSPKLVTMGVRFSSEKPNHDKWSLKRSSRSPVSKLVVPKSYYSKELEYRSVSINQPDFKRRPKIPASKVRVCIKKSRALRRSTLSFQDGRRALKTLRICDYLSIDKSSNAMLSYQGDKDMNKKYMERLVATKLDVRYMTELRNCFQRMKSSFNCGSAPDCPCLQERLQRHKMEHHDASSARPSQDFKPTDTFKGNEAQTKITLSNFGDFTISVEKRSAATSATVPELKKNHDTNTISKSVQYDPLMEKCMGEIQDVVREWTNKVPTHPGEDPRNKEMASQTLIDNIINLFKSRPDDFETQLKKEIEGCITQHDIWYPGSMTDREAFKEGLRDSLYGKFVNLYNKSFQESQNSTNRESRIPLNVEKKSNENYGNPPTSSSIDKYGFVNQKDQPNAKFGATYNSNHVQTGGSKIPINNSYLNTRERIDSSSAESRFLNNYSFSNNNSTKPTPAAPKIRIADRPNYVNNIYTPDIGSQTPRRPSLKSFSNYGSEDFNNNPSKTSHSVSYQEPLTQPAVILNNPGYVGNDLKLESHQPPRISTPMISKNPSHVGNDPNFEHHQKSPILTPVVSKNPSHLGNDPNFRIHQEPPMLTPVVSKNPSHLGDDLNFRIHQEPPILTPVVSKNPSHVGNDPNFGLHQQSRPKPPTSQPQPPMIMKNPSYVANTPNYSNNKLNSAPGLRAPYGYPSSGSKGRPMNTINDLSYGYGNLKADDGYDKCNSVQGSLCNGFNRLHDDYRSKKIRSDPSLKCTVKSDQVCACADKRIIKKKHMSCGTNSNEIEREISEWLKKCTLIKFDGLMNKQEIVDALILYLTPCLSQPNESLNRAVLKKKIVNVFKTLGICTNTTTGIKSIINKLADELAIKLIGIVSRLQCSGTTSWKCKVVNKMPFRNIEQIQIGPNLVNKEDFKQDLIQKVEVSLRGTNLAYNRDVLEEITALLISKIELIRRGLHEKVKKDLGYILMDTYALTDYEISNVINNIMEITKDLITTISTINDRTNTAITANACFAETILIYKSDQDMSPSFANTPLTPKKKNEVSTLSPEEKAYINKISAVIREWIEIKPEYFSNLDDKKMNEVMILDLADELLNHAKLGQLIKQQKIDPATFIKYCIYKWLLKFEVLDELEHAEPHTQELVKKLQGLSAPKFENVVEENKSDDIIKEFIIKYVEHNYNEDDPLAKGAYAKLLRLELQRLSPVILEELYEGKIQEHFSPEMLSKELGYVKDISDWLQNLPIDEAYNRVGNKNRIVFIMDLAKDVVQVEDERLQSPNAMNYDMYLANIICGYMHALPLTLEGGTRSPGAPIITQYVHDLLLNIFLKREENRSLLAQFEWANVADFLDDYVRLHGQDIANDELKLEVWTTRLLIELKKMIAENPAALRAIDIDDKLAKVPKPGDETIKRFAHELDYATEISDWLKNLPLNNFLDEEIIKDLAEKMAECDNKSDETDLTDFIKKWIQQLPLDKSKQIDVPFVTQQLLNRRNKVKTNKEVSVPLPMKHSVKAKVSNRSTATSGGRSLCRGCCPIDDPGAVIVQVIKEWCEKLPLTGTEENVKSTKNEIANKLYQKVIDMSDDPQLAHDDLHYMETFSDKLDQLMANLPTTVSLEGEKNVEKNKLLKNIQQARIFCKDVSVGDEYMQELVEAIEKTLPKPSPSTEVDPVFEVFKVNLAEIFVLENFDHGDDADKLKYQKIIKSNIEKYSPSAQKRKLMPIPEETLLNDTLGALFDVNMPDEIDMIDNVEEIKTKCEIEKWYENLPLQPVTGSAELLETNRRLRALAKKIHILEFEEDPDRNIFKEITKWLSKVPLVRGEISHIDRFATDLQQILKSTKKARKCIKATDIIDKITTSEISAKKPTIWVPNRIKNTNNATSRPRRKSGDTLIDIVEEWSNSIPLGANLPKDKEQLIKNNLTTEIIKKISELYSNHDTLNDDVMYNRFMDREIEKVMAALPQHDTLIKSKDALKKQLISTIASVKPLILEERARHEYKKELLKTISLFKELPDSPTTTELNLFSKMKEEIVDNFIQYQYNKDDEEGKQFYKNKMLDALTRYNSIGEKEASKKEIVADSLVETNHLICNLSKIPPPNDQALKEEVEEIRMKHEVDDFLNNVASTKYQALKNERRDSLKMSLSKQLHDIEKAGHNQDTDQKMKAAVSRTLKHLDVETKEDKIDDFIDRLQKNESIRKAPALKKDVEGNLRLSQYSQGNNVQQLSGGLMNTSVPISQYESGNLRIESHHETQDGSHYESSMGFIMRKPRPPSPSRDLRPLMGYPPQDSLSFEEPQVIHQQVDISVHRPDYIPPNWPPKPPLKKDLINVPHSSKPPSFPGSAATSVPFVSTQKLTQPGVSQTPSLRPGVTQTSSIPAGMAAQPFAPGGQSLASDVGVQSNNDDQKCLCNLCSMPYSCYDFYDGCEDYFNYPMYSPRILMKPPYI